MDSRGRYFLTGKDRKVLVFDSLGRFIRVLGREGRGPGEFIQPPRVLIGKGDTILAL
jgi:hypothetical protein